MPVKQKNCVLKLPQDWKSLIDIYEQESWWRDLSTVTSNEKLFYNLTFIRPEHVRVVFLGDIFYNELRVGSQAMKQFVQEICNQMEFSHNEAVRDSAMLSKLSNEGVLFLNTSAYSIDENMRVKYRACVVSILKRLFEINPKLIVLSLGGSNHQIVNECISSTTNEDNIICIGHPSPRATTSNFCGSNCFREVNSKLMSKGLFPLRYCCIFK